MIRGELCGDRETHSVPLWSCAGCGRTACARCVIAFAGTDNIPPPVVVGGGWRFLCPDCYRGQKALEVRGG